MYYTQKKYRKQGIRKSIICPLYIIFIQLLIIQVRSQVGDLITTPPLLMEQRKIFFYIGFWWLWSQLYGYGIKIGTILQPQVLLQLVMILCELPSEMTLYATADNSFVATLNSNDILTGNDWQKIKIGILQLVPANVQIIVPAEEIKFGTVSLNVNVLVLVPYVIVNINIWIRTLALANAFQNYVAKNIFKIQRHVSVNVLDEIVQDTNIGALKIAVVKKTIDLSDKHKKMIIIIYPLTILISFFNRFRHLQRQVYQNNKKNSFNCNY